MGLAGRIKARARELGFEKAGIARAGPLPRAAFLHDWLREGFHGGMAFMARAAEAREDLRKRFPWARSVLCVAKNYRAPGRAEGISRYAWGEDYHDLMAEPLRELCGIVGGRAKGFVDTSAVMEKLWAREAGLGWQGKHSNLVARDLGSWFFLGGILTDLELEPDAPHTRDYCGTCTRCIDACPTGAITTPYVVDSRRCIAYLTIEHRGTIPPELRPLLGNHVFGCDLCLEACPWNKFSKETPERGFRAREGDLLRFLSREEFDLRAAGTPLKRATYAGFLRNVAVALGNKGDRAAVPELEKGLAHEEPLVREHAAWALEKLVRAF